MKKLIAVVAAMIMVLAMSASVFATESGSPVVDDYDYVGSTGGSYEFVGYPEELGDGWQEIIDNLPDFLEENFEAEVPADADVILWDTSVIKSDSKVVTFTFEGLENEIIYVLQYADGKWKLFEQKVKDGQIAVKLGEGKSSVYLFSVWDAEAEKYVSIVTGDVDADTGEVEKKSHKTGY